jgi:uncharacterized protein (TIGR03435 family)
VSQNWSFVQQKQIVKVIFFQPHWLPEYRGSVGGPLAMISKGDGMFRWGGRATVLAILSAAILGGAACAQPTTIPSFDSASVKVSQSSIGHEGTITTGPEQLTARNVTLKRLVYEAWQAPYDRLTGGAEWVSTEEYDIDAKAPHPVSSSELRQMLRTLLANRFKLMVRTEKRKSRVYTLLVGKGGAKLHGPVGEDMPGVWRFHGDLNQFADVLALKLTIPLVADPAVPSVAQGTPVPVVNKTGIEGVFDLALPMSLDARKDPFTFWQRTLQEQLGLRLEPGREPVEFFLIEHAERVPSEN